MKRYSYAERDYAFGQRILTLRTRLGLTQAGLAKLLGVSRRAVSEWEAGSNYPTAGHLQHVLELGVQQHVFAPGQEEEEIRALWQAAHQKVILDEVWLSALLQQPSPPPVLVPVEESGGAAVLRTSAPGSLAQEGQPADSPLASGPDESNARSGPRVDWGRRWMCPAFMDASRNWPRSPGGWSMSAAGW